MPDTEPPSAPLLIGQADDTPTAHLDWSESTDNVGVSEYHVYKDGLKIAETTGFEYDDNDVTAGQSYTYYVVALDAAGNSINSNEVLVEIPTPPPPPPGPLFEDDFESGILDKWSFIKNLQVQGERVFDGDFAARAQSQSLPSYAVAMLDEAHAELSFETRFKLVSKSKHPVTLARFKAGVEDVGRIFLTPAKKTRMEQRRYGLDRLDTERGRRAAPGIT